MAIAAAIALGMAGIASPTWSQTADHYMPGMSHMAVTRRAAMPVAGPDQVLIDNFAFGPATLTVARGTTVTWINKDNDAHTVTAAGNKPMFKSPPLDTGDTFSFAFKYPGTYTYFCSIHPSMTGTIVVR